MKSKKLKFEKFSKLTDIQKMSIAFFVGLFVMLGGITLYKTFAVYKEEKTFDVIEGIVPDFKKKDKDLEIAIMVDGESRSEVPTESHDYRVTTSCEKDEADTISASWDYTNWQANFSGYITKPATCTINFESIYDSIKVNGEDGNIPTSGEYHYNITCENVTSYEINPDNYQPNVIGVNANSHCNLVYRTTDNIITKVKTIKLDGTEEEGYPEKSNNLKTEIICTPETVIGKWDKDAWKVKEINNLTNEATCEVKFTEMPPFYEQAEIGDYVAYTPNREEFSISADLTGCHGGGTGNKCGPEDQTIYPNKLTLWRVIKKNDEDKTIEIVSEYMTSEKIFFKGREGYQKLIGSLNTIASAYETEGVTSGSRYLGYNNQIQNCDNISKSDCPTDTGYTVDIELIQTAIGRTDALNPNDSTNGYHSYFIASRYYFYDTAGSYPRDSYKTRMFYWYDDEKSSLGSTELAALWIHNSESGWSDSNMGNSPKSLRPIVVLKSGIDAEYLGDKEDTNQNKTFKYWKVN